MKLYEYADEVTLPDGKVLDQEDKNCYPFLYFDGNDFAIGQEHATHIDLIKSYHPEIGFEGDDEFELLDDVLNNATYTGRIWLDDKMMAFWDLGRDAG